VALPGDSELASAGRRNVADAIANPTVVSGVNAVVDPAGCQCPSSAGRSCAAPQGACGPPSGAGGTSAPDGHLRGAPHARRRSGAPAAPSPAPAHRDPRRRVCGGPPPPCGARSRALRSSPPAEKARRSRDADTVPLGETPSIADPRPGRDTKNADHERRAVRRFRGRSVCIGGCMHEQLSADAGSIATMTGGAS
jgi:hypothetical protein